jgi:hypothetical protein
MHPSVLALVGPFVEYKYQFAIVFATLDSCPLSIGVSLLLQDPSSLLQSPGLSLDILTTQAMVL